MDATLVACVDCGSLVEKGALLGGHCPPCGESVSREKGGNPPYPMDLYRAVGPLVLPSFVIKGQF